MWAAVRRAMQRMGEHAWTLRTVLMASLLVFSIVPATLVGWYLYQSNLNTTDVLTEKILADTAQRVQSDTETLLAEAHVIFNGLVHQYPGASDLDRARQLIQKPEQFEQAAFPMARMSSNVSYLYMGTYQGEFMGVENQSQDANNPLRVPIRKLGETGRHQYAAQFAGDRSKLSLIETNNYEPRSRPWYQAAVQHKGRVFTPVYPSASNKQLVITLAQPVYGADGGVLGVFAIDVYLRQISELVQRMTISAHGGAFIVDEQGFLVASSAGDLLFQEVNGKQERYKPDASSNAVIRAAYNEVQPSIGKTTDKALGGSVQRKAFQRKIGTGNDTLFVALKPFGESLGLRWTLVVVAPESDFAGASQAALKKTALIVTALVLLAAGLAVWLAYRLSTSFRALGQAAVQLAMGDVPQVRTMTHILEVRRLLQIMRDSTQEIVSNRTAIEAQTVALREANETLEDRVTRRTAELEASREEALGAARAKASFLATMSHEIRTPLNGVVGMTTLLADTPLNGEQRDYLHTMRVSSDQLLGVINDVLDFSKIESGKLDLENEPMSLRSTIEEACDMGAAGAREKGLELLVDIDDGVPDWVRGDVTRLRQILLNFVNNAVKFTDKGQVVVSAHLLEDFKPGAQASSGALIEFRVKDTGIGVPADRHATLFQSFTQLDASTTRKYGGTGLGLAICKRLAELMGGSVGLRSVPNEGSTFWFTARMGYADTRDVSQTSMFQMVSLSGKKALVVDDTALNLRILDKQLTRWGMQTTLFERAQPALDWLQTNSVDVIVTDMHMPDMDGQTFAQRIRKNTPDAHIVLLTSGSMPTGEAAKLFDSRMLKPHRQSQLFDALSRVTAAVSATKIESSNDSIPGRNQLILVADDNPVNLKVALAMLTKLGYEASTAINGREAVDRVAESLRTGTGTTPRPYAAVLMDANMPVMDGFEASRQILATHANPPPLIALTASVLEEDRQRCLAAGMVGFLPKPLRIDELAEVLARHAQTPEDAHATVINATEIVAARALAASHTAQNGTQIPPAPVLVLMDWNRLEQFKEFDDDQRTMTREVIDLFAADAPIRMNDIYAAYRGNNSAALSRATHALKGSASNVGAQALADACFSLEQSCLQGQWPVDAGPQVGLIAELGSKTLNALDEWVA